jgi:hypothetical protein
MKKLINFPKEQIDYIEKQCKKYGSTFSEYIRKNIMIEMMVEKSTITHKQVQELIDSGTPVIEALKQLKVIQ